MSNPKPLLAALVLALSTAAPHAATIFSDNFEAEAPGTILNYTAFTQGWVVNGSVDLLVDYFPGLSGKYVDLDGSTAEDGRSFNSLSKTLTLEAGVTYTAFYDLAGSQRGGADLVTARFGTESRCNTCSAVPIR